MKFLHKLAVENRKLAFYLVALVAVGVFALTLQRSAPTEAPPATVVHSYPSYHAPPPFPQERALEARLEEIFALVEGAGKVRVLISPLTGRETVFAVDTSSSKTATKEEDAQGGTREITGEQLTESTVVITDRQGGSQPLVVKEIAPSIGGIVIVAQGGNNPHVQDALTRAARVVLGLDAHMIQVLPGDF